MTNYRRKSWRTEMAVRVDVNGALDSGIGEGGVSVADLEGLAARLAEVQGELEARRGEQFFRQLPLPKKVIQEVVSLAREVRGEFDTLVVLGIGGSALGTSALVSALRSPFQEGHPGSEEEGARIIVADNVDPRTIAAILDEIDLHKTAFNVVSKSGETAETISQFLVVRERLLKLFGAVDYSRHVIITTDAGQGALRQIVNDEGFRSLTIPEGAHGHLAVFSPVALFPAAVSGIDVHAVLAGAEEMDARCRSASPFENPALLHAGVRHLARTRHERRVQVLMPYADALGDLADWYAQLTAECLGKKRDRGGAEVSAGQATVTALGAADQHSLLQVLAEGPDETLVTFLKVDDPGPRLEIPSRYADLEDVAYLGGRTLADLLNLEQGAAEALLARSARPSTTIRIPAINAFTLGQVFYLLGLETLVSAALYRVDPWIRPGIDEGRRLVAALAGRRGLDDLRAELQAWAARRDPRFVV